MDRVIATSVNALMLEFSAKLDDSLDQVMKSCSSDDFDRYRAAVSKILEIMLYEIMNPIYKSYPDIKPKELD